MAKVKLGLIGLSVEKKLSTAKTIATKIGANPAYAAQTLALKNATTALDEAETTRETAERALAAAVSAELDAEKTFDEAYGDLATEVQQVSKGDETAILEAGFGVVDANTAPAEMPAVEALSATFGDEPGEVDLTWNPVRNRRIYDVQWTADAAAATGWAAALMPTRSRASVPGLPTGTRVWLRVRAVGATGPGPWSAAVQQLVP